MRTCSGPRSASEKTAMLRMFMSRSARMMRKAISPRLAIRTRPNMQGDFNRRVGSPRVVTRRAIIQQMTPERWEQIQQLYLRAVDLPGEERAELLSSASPEVRQRVHAMLAQPTWSQLLDQPAWEAVPESSANIILGAQPGLGSQLGAYRIETVLGEGGMGVVYRALDTKLNRPVAVKFLSDDLADAASRRRFQREAHNDY